MRKRILLLILSIALLTSCGVVGQNTDEDALFPITVTLDWTPNTNHTGLYVAIDQGYFEDLGLDVTVIQPAENSAVSLTASGQAQFGFDAQDTMAAALAIDKPLDIIAIAAILQHNTSGIIARKGEGLDKPEGLVGNRYSTWNNPIELAIVENLVEAGGGNFDDVTLIPNTVTDEAAALRTDQTDAIWIFYGWSGINAELSDLDFDYYHLSDLNPVFDYYTPVLIANTTFLDEQPEEAKAFMAALSKGYEFAVEKPNEAARMLMDGDSTNSLSGAEDLVLASQAWLSERYMEEDVQFGYIDQARWDAFYEWLFEEGLIDQKLSSGEGFTNEFLPTE